MKSMSTRLISTVLSLVLVSSMLGVPAFADETDTDTSTEVTTEETSADENVEVTEEVTEQSSDVTTEELGLTLEASADMEDEKLTNTVTVEIFDRMPFVEGSQLHFDISLGEHGTDSIDTHYTVDDYYHGLATFKDVEPGTYDLLVTSPKFQDYKQTIYVSDEQGNDGRNIIRSYKVILYTWDFAIADMNLNHPGIIFYGDVTGDRSIDEADIDVLIDAVQNKSTEPSRDLSGSGSASLLDLQILSEGYGRDDVISTTARSLLSHNLDNVEITEEVVLVEGANSMPLSDLIGNQNQETAVKIQTSTSDPISQEHPVSIVFNNLDMIQDDGVEAMVIKPPHVENASTSVDTRPQEGTITAEYEDENGFTQTMNFTFMNQDKVPTIAENVVEVAQKLGFLPMKAYADSVASAYFDSDGNIVVDFGKKIAIKKVTLKITKVANESLNLCEISSVEFLNSMEDRIPAPEMNIPTGLTGSAASKKFTISWDPQPEGNVHGYEVYIEENGKHQIITTKNCKLTVESFAYGKKGKLENGHTYTVKVQSMNGQWRSGWCDQIYLTPMATKVPDPPENVSVSGGYKLVNVSWKAMEDTDSYNVFYSVKGSNEWKNVKGIEANKYTINNLLDKTEYQVYVTGVNQIGESRPSATASCSTVSIDPVDLPDYKLINTQKEDGTYLTNIANARQISGGMKDSPLDTTSGSALGIFDGDFKSYFAKSDWDLGCSYNSGSHGIEVTFTSPQNIGFISYAASTQNIEYSSVVLYAKNSAGKMVKTPVDFVHQKCSNGRNYVLVRIPSGVTTDKILLGMNRYARYIDIAEMRIHAYDDIEDQINNLYTDSMHITLNKSVHDDPSILDTLQTRLNTPDPASGEYYPYKSTAQRELDFARKLLEDENAGLGEVIEIHTDLNDAADSGKNLGISGLNAWQPLGKVAAANDKIVAYVASPSSKTVGNTSNSKIQLYVGQHYAESNNPPSYAGVFPIGRKQVAIPQRVTTDVERGSQLYVQYSGSNANEKWYIRIMGATDSPMLDLYKDYDQASRQAKVAQYLTELDERVDALAAAKANEADHDALHSESIDEKGVLNPNVANNDYRSDSCILNSTEIMTDYMLYSVAADKAIAAAGSRTDDMTTRVNRFLATMDGTDQMMELFYQHKGLAAASMGAAKTNTAPARHLNIRQMRMFAGAFMYASGNHIGVGYSSGGEFAMLRPISDAATAPGGTRSANDGKYFGWGSAHEIGHNINDGRYAFAEVTNNYFAQLCKSINGGGVRWSYDNVYAKVTSGATGRGGNVFVQLAMYWQLMLAHDNNEIYTLYSDVQSMLDNRIVARMDTYARVPANAPAPNGVALTLNGGESQNVIRLASAAAQKNLSKFFTAWGLVPNAATIEYISQFPEETRGLQYITDDCVKWTRANPDAPKVTNVNMVSSSINQKDSLVTVSITSTDASYNNSILGYEISRIVYAEGKPQTEVIGFSKTTDGNATFVDHASFLGNRTVMYEVKAVDKFMNYSAPFKTNQIKLDGSGLYNAKDWEVTTNMTSDQDQINETVSVTGESSCSEEVSKNIESAVQKLVNGTLGADYTGTAAKADPYILIDMRAAKAVSNIRYTPAANEEVITDYKIEASVDNLKFTQISQGKISIDQDTGYANIFFYGQDESGISNPWITTETARYLRITAVGMAGKKIGIGNIQVFGPSGDNVDFLKVDGEDIEVIGTLAQDYKLENDEESDKVIPAGSIVFTGKYKGNPAYNVVVLYDEAGNIVGGTKVIGDEEHLLSEQVILAEDPGDALLGDTSDGRWVYWISNLDNVTGKVRAELYRVDNALTNEGQRLVSDSLFVEIPATLPSITFKSN